MKTKILFTVIVSLSLYSISCSKESGLRSNDQNIAKTKSADQLSLSICDQFAYSDTIFYPQELPNDYIIHTITPLTGTFGCFPDELKMNSINGDIDITEGETGLKYLVWFVPAGTKDTCKKFITISGIDFTDSIYTLKNSPGIATPVYNSTRQLQPACTTGCEFDDGPDDDDGDGIADEPLPGQEVIPQGIAMDKSTGAINLRQSLINGALGANPAPGTFKDFLLNYRISDASHKTLNKIAFRLYYFKTQSQIPLRLKRELAAKKAQVILNDDVSVNNFSYTVNTGLTAKNGAGEVKCRPPYIIVVQK